MVGYLASDVDFRHFTLDIKRLTQISNTFSYVLQGLPEIFHSECKNDHSRQLQLQIVLTVSFLDT